MNIFKSTIWRGIICIATFVMVPCSAQVVVEDDVSTDTVNLFVKNNQQEKSGILAMGASIVLPGLGQQYLGQKTRSLAYYSAEALFLFGAILCDHYSKQLVANSKAFAWEHANALGGDQSYWQNVGQYDESDGFNQSKSRGYNKMMELVYRSQDFDYVTPELQWRWDQTDNRKNYNKILDQSKSYQVASSFFLGAMILDRLLSFVDVRFAAQHQINSSLAAIRISPNINTASKSTGIIISAQF